MAPHKSEDSTRSDVQETKRKLQDLATQRDYQVFKQHKTSTGALSADLVANVSQLLARAAASTAGIVYYRPGSGPQQALRLSYAELLGQAKEKLRLMYRINGLERSSIVLLHFDNQIENIIWLWACIIGGFLPAISTPFVADKLHRKQHISHLQKLLQKPVILTTATLVHEFLDIDELSLYTVESLTLLKDRKTLQIPDPKRKDEVAILMLTSGSTGSAKAVPLRHYQLITAIKGKSQHHCTKEGDVFLNWVGLDHVASLTEIHLHAMSLSSDQIHVPAAMLQEPLEFLRLLDVHKVAYTFAPNFFLTKVRDSLHSARTSFKADLSHLRALISGGESNVVATCDALTKELGRFGLRGEVIRPGFGMTETCAGSIYSRACPSYDLRQGLEFANLGNCIPGLEMRVTKLNSKELAENGENGNLQISGPVLFDHYFNNPEATKEAFTADGWFDTGDLAYIDDKGFLNLTGRTKDTIIVNGVKWSSTELETAIEGEGISGLVPSFTVIFPHRAHNSATEDICVVYSPKYAANDDTLRFETANAIAKTVSLICGRKPGHLLPLPTQLLEKSSLGKISRNKVRAGFERGDFASYQEQDTIALARYRKSDWKEVETPTERVIQITLAHLLDMPSEEINMKASIFELGVDSFNLIMLKAMLEKRVDTIIDIPISVLLTK